MATSTVNPSHQHKICLCSGMFFVNLSINLDSFHFTRQQVVLQLVRCWELFQSSRYCVVASSRWHILKLNMTCLAGFFFFWFCFFYESWVSAVVLFAPPSMVRICFYEFYKAVDVHFWSHLKMIIVTSCSFANANAFIPQWSHTFIHTKKKHQLYVVLGCEVCKFADLQGLFSSSEVRNIVRGQKR